VVLIPLVGVIGVAWCPEYRRSACGISRSTGRAAGFHSLSIEWIEATGFQPVRFSERMRGLPDFEAARRVKLQNPGDPT
jgi:hypothetical protein